MSVEAKRKARLHKLLDLARVYRSWNRAELSRALDRSPTKLYPDSGNPKLDFIISLAEALEWSVDDVVDYVWAGDAYVAQTSGAEDFESLDLAARDAHRGGDFGRMIELARRMYAVARTAEEKARACNREHGGWDGLGRYTKALEAVCRGLQHGPLPERRRLQLQTNLAATHYTLWELKSAHAHAHVVIEWYMGHSPEDSIGRKNQAFAHYVRGNTFRRLVAQEPENAERCARSAKGDLETAFQMYSRLAQELSDDRLAGIANTCHGGLLEVDVEVGLRSPQSAVQEFLGGLDRTVEGKAGVAADWLESFGWWCIFGANVALRYLKGRELQRTMGVFTNKALEIADRLDNWALRERVFTMQYTLHQVLVDSTGLELDFTIDDEDVRMITGTMGRFPAFRGIGWKIFQTGKVIKDLEGN